MTAQENGSPIEVTGLDSGPDGFAGAQFPAAMKAFERFLGAVATLVSGQLGLPVEIQPPSATQCFLKDALTGGEPDGCVVPLDLTPFPGVAYLAFGRAFVISAVEILLGAPLAFAGQPREVLTELDLHVLDGVIDSAVAELQSVWTPLCGAAFQRVPADSGGHDSPVEMEKDPVVVLSAELLVNCRPERLRLIVPSLLARMAGPKQGAESGPERARLIEALASATVDVEAVLKGSDIRFRDVVRLRAGMVLALPQKSGTPVECHVNGVPKFRGEMIRSGSGAALLVQSLLFPAPSHASQSPQE